jgi:hypothetical protein
LNREAARKTDAGWTVSVAKGASGDATAFPRSCAVFHVARLFADEDDLGRRGTLAENGLRRAIENASESPCRTFGRYGATGSRMPIVRHGSA